MKSLFRTGISQRNLGATKNFENIINLCTRYIIFLSYKDDVWHPEKLDKIEKLFFNSPLTGAVFTDGELVWKLKTSGL
jgi:hypothetical protein